MNHLRFLTAGESHGKALTAILEGVPAGLRLDPLAIDHALARRQQGYGRGGRMKIEHDHAEILSGVRFGETIGSPITLQVQNKDFANWQERMAAFGEETGARVTAARPGHADLTGVRKYDRRDIRDILERASARETTMRVAVGAILKQFLQALGIKISSAVVNLGGISVDAANRDDAHWQNSELNCYDPTAEVLMKKRVDEAKAAGDTLGGIFEVTVKNVPIGLGSYIQWDRRLDASLAAALMSIQAIKGVEIGAGFGYAKLLGSEAHDEMFYDDLQNVYRQTNRAGGLEGGMTNGEDIILRAVMKPIPTLMKPLHSIDIASKREVLASKERSDVTAVAAASVVGEAMTAIALADAVLEKFASDNMTDLLADFHAYTKRIQEA